MNAKSPKNQTRSTLLAFLAVVCFGIYECVLKHSVQGMSIWLCLTYRFLFTGYIFFLLLYATGERDISFNPRNIDGIIWLRALITTSYMTSLAISFAHAPSQAFVYPLFFLHPLWHALFHRIRKKKFSDGIRMQMTFLIISLAGSFMYLYFSLDTPLSALLPKIMAYGQTFLGGLVGGIGFAASNELGNYIEESAKNGQLKFSGLTSIDNISSLRISAYTTYACILLLPICVPVIKWISYLMGIDNTEAIHLPDSSSIFVSFSVGCTFVAGGSLLITKAFQCSVSTAKTAAIDYLILPVACVLDLTFGKKDAAPPVGTGLIFSIITIVIGALIYPILEDKFFFSHRNKADNPDKATFIA